MPASFYLTAVRNGVTIAEASVSLLDAVTIDEWLSSLGVPDDDSSTSLKGWMVSAVAGDVTDVIVQGDCAVSQLMTEAVDAGLANFGDNIVITAVYEESSGGGGSVSDTAKKYVDQAAAQELVRKTETLVGKKQDSLMHFTMTVTADDWAVNGNGYCNKVVSASDAGFSGNVVAHVSPLDMSNSQVNVVSSGFKVLGLTWAESTGYTFTLQAFGDKASGTLPSASMSFGVWGYASSDGKCHVVYDALALPVNAMGSVIQSLAYPLLHTDAYTALQKKLDVAGGTMTGDLTAPNVNVDDGIVLSHMLRGQGTASDYWHAIDIGHYGADGTDFYEYNGTFSFYQSTEAGTKASAAKVGAVTPTGWNGDARLTGSPTAPTPASSNNSTRIATTAFVKTAVGAIPSLPASTASDSGKFLTVNSSGEAEWTTVPSASGVSF